MNGVNKKKEVIIYYLYSSFHAKKDVIVTKIVIPIRISYKYQNTNKIKTSVRNRKNFYNQ